MNTHLLNKESALIVKVLSWDVLNVPIETKEVARVPSNTVEVDSDTAISVMKLLEKLEDHDDVQHVYTNMT